MIFLGFIFLAFLHTIIIYYSLVTLYFLILSFFIFSLVFSYYFFLQRTGKIFISPTVYVFIIAVFFY